MQNKTIPTIQTSRLILRPLVTADAEDLFHINQTDGVLRYFPTTSPPPLEKIQQFVISQQNHWDTYGYGNWGIVPKGESQIIGWAGLQFLPELNDTEVGYLLDAPFWGKGYATEAAIASIQYGFDHCALDQVIALVHPDNIASNRVIEKCGMIYEETIYLWRTNLMRHRLHGNRWKEMANL